MNRMKPWKVIIVRLASCHHEAETVNFRDRVIVYVLLAVLYGVLAFLTNSYLMIGIMKWIFPPDTHAQEGFGSSPIYGWVSSEAIIAFSAMCAIGEFTNWIWKRKTAPPPEAR